MGVDAALARRYAEPTQVYDAVELKCSAMAGRATVTIVVSRAERKTANFGGRKDIVFLVLWLWKSYR